MTIYKPNPTYYRVTWDQTGPNVYTGLTGTQAGGLDAVSPIDYHNKVSITGNGSLAGTPMAGGDSLYINGVKIVFSGADTISDIIVKINMHGVLTNVIAHNLISANFITLTNASTHEGEPITLEEGSGALAVFDIVPGVYKHFPNIVGGAFAGLVGGNVFSFNGTNITFNAPADVSLAGCVNKINQYTQQTGVVAYTAAGTIQLSSINGQAIVIASGDVGSNPTVIGFPAGVYRGAPYTLAQSEAKSLANLRWQMVINALEEFSTPFVLNDVFATGNYDGSAELDTFSFTIGYDHPDQIATFEARGEPNPGNLLEGVDAIRRAVARGLIGTYSRNVSVFDPTIEVRGSHAIMPNAVRIKHLTATGVDMVSNTSLVEANISVTMIAYE